MESKLEQLKEEFENSEELFQEKYDEESFKESQKDKEYHIWNDIDKGYEFSDGSVVTQRHINHDFEFYKIKYSYYQSRLKSLFKVNKEISLSADHLLLCDISKMSEELKDEVKRYYYNEYIPIGQDIHLYIDENKSDIETRKALNEFLRIGTCPEDKLEDVKELLGNILMNTEIKESEPHRVDEDLYWISVEYLHLLINKGEKIFCNGYLLKSSFYEGMATGMCVSTDTGKYEFNDLIHHNSVSLRAIIFHILTHSNKVSVAMVDLKQTEFTRYKKFKDVVGVANSVLETAELLRVAREIMNKRNKQMGKMDLQEFTDFRPKEPTDRIWISGRELQEDTVLKVRVNGEDREMSVKDIHNYLHQ